MVIRFSLNNKEYRAEHYSIALGTESDKLGGCLPRQIQVRLDLDPQRNAGADIMKFASNQATDSKKMTGSIDVFNGNDGVPVGEAIQQVKFSDGFLLSMSESASKHDDTMGVDLAIKAFEVTISGEKFVVPKPARK